MAITYGELKKIILLKIDEYEADADAMTTDDDIIARMPDVINEAIRFVFYGKGHNQTWNVMQGVSVNALEREKNDPDYVPLSGEHRTEPVVFEADNVYDFFFEVDDTAEVTIENYNEEDDEWVVLHAYDYHNEQPFSEFKQFKGRMTADGTAVRARITFGGSYFYHYRNVCLHNVAYETDDKVPEYTGFRQHDIPKNLYQIVEAYRIVDGERKNISYYTEDYKLYLPDVEGTIYLVSKFFPDKVNLDTPDDYVIDIPIDTEFIVANKASALLMMEGDYAEFIADEEQGMQMLEGDRGRSGAPKVVRLH